jgi:hypothetical protein
MRTYNVSGVLAFLCLDDFKETAVILKACERKQAWKCLPGIWLEGFCMYLLTKRELAGSSSHTF